jgi:ABC-type antimicrobial peptide transport system permease subunit
VLSYAVTRRRKEFGIRSAVGAAPRQLRRLVLRDGFLVTGAGVSIGVVGATSLGRVLASLQYGIGPGDPVSWLIVCAALVLTALLAAWRPARAAARADALVLLRDE